MVQYPILINLDKNTYDSLHRLLGKKIVIDDREYFRLFPEDNKQICFREIIRAGIFAKEEEYNKKLKELKDKDEDKNSN